MSIHRRTFLKLAAAGAALAVYQRAVAARRGRSKVKALAFDAFPIFDPRPVFALAEKHFRARARS